jgi:ATP/maltotriose-dependent transcriptional regulator MalT
VAAAQGQTDESRAALAAARAQAQATGGPRLQVRALSVSAELANDRGEAEEAEALARTGLRLSAPHRDRWGFATALQQLGRAALTRGDLVEARYLLRESAELFEEIGDKVCLGQALIALGAVECGHGDAAAARRCLQEALAIAWSTHLTPLVIGALAGLAALAAAAGETERALALLAPAITHPAADHATRTHALERYAALAPQLNPAALEAAPLEALVGGLLG